MFTTMTKEKKMKDKVKPYDKREVKNKKKAFKHSGKTVKTVIKDTNKTRRKNTLLPLKGKIKVKSFDRKSTNELKNIK